MADKAAEGHKRAKPSVALSLLHRDRSKREKRDGEGSANLAPTVAASTASLASQSDDGTSELSPTPSRLSTTGPTATTLTKRESNDDMAASPARGKAASIEQSVRMFRLFEALRKGDTAAILKAVKETSARVGSEKDPRTSTSSLTSTNGASGPLEGTTVLHLSVQCAEVPVVEYILSIATTNPGVDVDLNGRDRDGNTALHLASSLGRTQIVRLLLEQQAINDSVQNYQGRMPIDLARTPDIFQQLQLARSLFLDNKVKQLQAAVAKHDYEELERILVEPRVQTLLDVNGTELATDPATLQSGGTLLHEAARSKDIRLIELLLLNGADPFRRDHKGKLPQDVTKDDKTRAMLKKSPAAAVAQRGIQEKAVLGSPLQTPMAAPGTGSAVDLTSVSKEARDMKGYLKKWTNYTSGYKLRWFVLEDGVLSYYKHQDDAGSACRGAIHMSIAKLFMDPQDKQRFEIQGKSSVKYHLKANHVVEAKRWYWALNNAIQWSKDKAKEDERKKTRDSDMLRQAKMDQARGSSQRDSTDGSSLHPKRHASPHARHMHTGSLGGSTSSPFVGGASTGPGSVMDDDEVGPSQSYEPSAAGDLDRVVSKVGAGTLDGDMEEDEDVDEGSGREAHPASKDAFNITAQSAKMQLDLLAQISMALQVEGAKKADMKLSDTEVVQALSSYETAVRTLKGLVGDLLKISKDRDAYWQYRLDREANVRRMWEDSMTRVAQEQEALEGRIDESEIKRKRTKKALREALENNASTADSRPKSRDAGASEQRVYDALDKVEVDDQGKAVLRRKSSAVGSGRRKSVMVDIADISDSDSAEDEEFFDAIDAGEVVVVTEMPTPVTSPPAVASDKRLQGNLRDTKGKEIMPSFRGYDDPVRQRLKLDADNRPKISLWGILKSMIGKDMTKMTLPVSFNEPTSLLQRVAEDMEYTDLLDSAADRVDSAERLVYVATFAASEYASTIGRVAKPFNPLLGETYEYARPDKGYRFFVEQVTHHPPVGAACAESAKWDYYGESAVKSKFYGKSFEFNPLGTWFLKLRPASGGEELYTWKKVTSSVVGIITNNPTVDNYGPMEVKNWTTGEVCNLDFKQRGWRAAGAFQVQGKVMGSDGTTKWSIGGHWNDKIYARPGFEMPATPPKAGTGATPAFLVWQAHERPSGIPFNLTPFVVTLNALPDRLRPQLPPTDTRLRPDQRAMEDGEYDFAATEKNRVEEKQRAKRRMREANGEGHEPRWFRKATCAITGEDYWEFGGEYWKMRDEVARGGAWQRVDDIF